MLRNENYENYKFNPKWNLCCTHEICMKKLSFSRPVLCLFHRSAHNGTQREALMHKIFRILKIHINFRMILYLLCVCVSHVNQIHFIFNARLGKCWTFFVQIRCSSGLKPFCSEQTRFPIPETFYFLHILQKYTQKF